MGESASERIVEWAGLGFGLLGTAFGGVSLFLLWSDYTASQEKLAVTVNLQRQSHKTVVQKASWLPGYGGTIETRWDVWITNTSSREATIVAGDVSLVLEGRREVTYSNLLSDWLSDGDEPMFPQRVEPGQVVVSTIVVNYPIAQNAINVLFDGVSSEIRRLELPDIEQAGRRVMVASNKDFFGNSAEVRAEGDSYFATVKDISKDPLLTMEITTARAGRFNGYAFWYKLYDPTK